MRQTLAKLNYPSESLENGLVAAYLDQAGLTIKKNSVLATAAQAADQTIVDEISRLKPGLSLNDIAAAFELMIPDQDRQLNGAFFTPEKISRFMAEAIITSDQETICDPSCGCGALLLAAAAVSKDKGQRSLREVLEENIYGVDICDYNIRRARLLLNLYLTSEAGDDYPLQDNLVVANSLDSDFALLFPKVFERGGFDCLIGNPPYVRFQHLDARVRVDLQKFETIDDGNYNLYIPFYELGYRLLAADGRLAYITPNAFFTVKSARAFRRWAQKTKFIETIYDFSDNKVFDVSAYTLIALADRGKKNSIAYARLSGVDDLTGTIKTSAVPYKSLGEKKWDMISARQRKMINKIEASDNIALGELVNIRGGIATLRDRLYMAQTHQGRVITNYQGKYYPLEEEATRPLLRISDFSSDRELKNNQRRVIYPYQEADGRVEIIADQEMEARFPLTYRYLKLIAPELKKRDKGQKQYPAFYAYGRGQGLTPPGPALLTPLHASRPRFLRSNNRQALIVNGLALTPKPGGPYDLTTLQCLLNDSPVLDFYMKSLGQIISGGYVHYRADLLRRFCLPRLSKGEIKELKMHKDRRLIEEFYGL